MTESHGGSVAGRHGPIDLGSCLHKLLTWGPLVCVVVLGGRWSTWVRIRLVRSDSAAAVPFLVVALGLGNFPLKTGGGDRGGVGRHGHLRDYGFRGPYTSRASAANGIANATGCGGREGDRAAAAAARAALLASSRRFWSARRQALKLSKPSRCHFSIRRADTSTVKATGDLMDRRNQKPDQLPNTERVCPGLRSRRIFYHMGFYC